MKEIIVNGKALPVHFGMKAINEFTKRQGMDFDRAVTTTEPLANLDSIVELAVSGFNEGARLAGREERYGEDDVWDMFDAEPNLIIDISDAFIECVEPLADKLGALSKNVKRPAGKPTKPGSRKR